MGYPFIPNLRARNIWNPQDYNDLVMRQSPFPPLPDWQQSQMPIPNAPDNTPLNVQPLAQPIQPTPQPVATPSPVVDPNDVDVNALYQQYYHPEHAASDQFNQLMSAYPQDKGHGKLARIGAALLAGGTSFVTDDPMKGFQLGSGALEYGRNKKIADWKNQVGPAYQNANLERTANVNERQTATSIVNQKLADRKQEQSNKIAEDKNVIAADRNKILDWKNKNPNLKFNYDGPTVLVSDPTTGKTVDSGVKTGNIDDVTKLMTQHENKVEEIKVKGQTDVKTAESTKWIIGTVPDPTDPTKQIGVKMNQITGETVPIQMGGQNVVNPSKLPTVKPAGGVDADKLEKIQQNTRETLAEIDNLLDPKTNKLTSIAQAAVGKSRMFGLQYIPGFDAKAGDVTISRVKARLITDLIAEMKAQSRTGATGFGQLNMKELGVLDNAASKLDPTLPEAEFETELLRVREKLQKILQPATGLDPTVNRKSASERLKQYDDPQ
jgi:hypothetical protein